MSNWLILFVIITMHFSAFIPRTTRPFSIECPRIRFVQNNIKIPQLPFSTTFRSSFSIQCLRCINGDGGGSDWVGAYEAAG